MDKKTTIVQDHSENFDTLHKAFANNNVCILDCIEKSSGDHVAVICTYYFDNKTKLYNFTPFARFFNGNPYDLLIPPADYNIPEAGKVNEPDTEYRPVRSTDSDFIDALEGFVASAMKLNDVWGEHPMADFLGVEDYPPALSETSFDDFVSEVRNWFETQKTFIEQSTLVKTLKEITEKEYSEMLDVMPPIYLCELDEIKLKGFAMSEPYTHTGVTSVFHCYFTFNGKYYETLAEVFTPSGEGFSDSYSHQYGSKYRAVTFIKKDQEEK